MKMIAGYEKTIFYSTPQNQQTSKYINMIVKLNRKK